MERQGWDSKQIYTRLVGRYGPSQGLYLFGEFCLLVSVGLDAFQRRHTPAQMRALEALLRPLQLWPYEPHAQVEPQMLAEPPLESLDPLELVARTLLTPPFQLALGPDLFHGCVAWAASESGANGDPGAWFESARSALTETLGFTPPRLQVILGDGLDGFAYRLFVQGRAVEEGHAFPGLDLLLGPEEEAPPALPYPWEPDPTGRGWVAWMPIGEGAEPPEALPRLHWMTAVSRHLSATLPRHAADLLTVRMVHELLLEAEAGGYDHELERFISVPELRYVFQALLRQRIPLRPMPKMLEVMLQHILTDLSRRKLAHEELEKINRQLPFYPARRLVTVVRQGLGLGEEPTLTYRDPGPPAAPRAELLWPEGDDRPRWEAMFALVAETQADARFWLRVFSHGAPVGTRRQRAIAAWSLTLGGLPDKRTDLAAVYQSLENGSQVDAAARMLTRYVQAAREIRKVEAALRDPVRRTSPELAVVLASPDWERWQWSLREPSRWLQRAVSVDAGSGLDVSGPGCEVT